MTGDDPSSDARTKAVCSLLAEQLTGSSSDRGDAYFPSGSKPKNDRAINKANAERGDGCHDYGYWG